MKLFILLLAPMLFFVGCQNEPIPEPIPVVVEVIPEPVVVLEKFPFTMKMIHKYSLSSLDICKLQLYISHDIQLQRKIPASSSTIDNGSLVVNKEDKIDTILIKKDTPCVAIEAENNYIVVKFNENVQLSFMYTPGKKDLFLLSANKWKDGKGSLVINEKEYQAVGTSGQSHLLFNKIDIDNSANDAKVLEGSTL